ncbi:MAG: hypothetical protein ABI353_12375 [Isosphaeraceae bacterium]
MATITSFLIAYSALCISVLEFSPVTPDNLQGTWEGTYGEYSGKRDFMSSKYTIEFSGNTFHEVEELSIQGKYSLHWNDGVGRMVKSVSSTPFNVPDTASLLKFDNNKLVECYYLPLRQTFPEKFSSIAGSGCAISVWERLEHSDRGPSPKGPENQIPSSSWKLISKTVNGNQSDTPTNESNIIEFFKDEYTKTRAIKLSGIFSINEININFQYDTGSLKGTEYLGIVDMNRDWLKINRATPGRNRPENFETKNNAIFYYRLLKRKRVPDKE